LPAARGATKSPPKKKIGRQWEEERKKLIAEEEAARRLRSRQSIVRDFVVSHGPDVVDRHPPPPGDLQGT